MKTYLLGFLWLNLIILWTAISEGLTPGSLLIALISCAGLSCGGGALMAMAAERRSP